MQHLVHGNLSVYHDYYLFVLIRDMYVNIKDNVIKQSN